MLSFRPLYSFSLCFPLQLCDDRKCSALHEYKLLKPKMEGVCMISVLVCSCRTPIDISTAALAHQGAIEYIDICLTLKSGVPNLMFIYIYIHIHIVYSFSFVRRHS